MRRKDREVHSINEIIEILNSCKTCHIGLIDHDIPYVVPLSYGYEMNEEKLTLYFHCAKEGRKLDILKVNNKVCFELCREGAPAHIETPCNSGYDFSSIIGYGEAIKVEDSQERKKALTLMFYRQTGKMVEFTDAQAEAVFLFKIVSSEYSGKVKPSPLDLINMKGNEDDS